MKQYVLFVEFEELPASQGVFLDNTNDEIFSEQWTDSEPKDDPTYTPDIMESSQPSEAGSEWSSQKQSVSAKHPEICILIILASAIWMY